jgi:hypothetical protein
MTKHCLKCNKGYEAERVTSKYCSDNCRKLAFRDKDNVSVPKLSVPRDFSEYGAQDLYDEIGTYQGDAWKECPAYKELCRRLEKKSIEQLKLEGYFIPNWKVGDGVPPWKK